MAEIAVKACQRKVCASEMMKWCFRKMYLRKEHGSFGNVILCRKGITLPVPYGNMGDVL